MELALRWARLELRGGWRALTGFALLLALATATILGAAAGARRGSSSVDRLLENSLPAHALIGPAPTLNWDAVRRLPEVTAVATQAESAFLIDGMYSERRFEVAPCDLDGLSAVERPAVISGRLPDAARDDEVVVNSAFLHASSHKVGDRVNLHLFRPEEVDDLVAEPSGPVVSAEIVGVVRSSYFLGSRISEYVIASPGLCMRHRPNFFGSTDRGNVLGLVRLRGGAADLGTLQSDVEGITGGKDAAVIDNAEFPARDRSVVSFESGFVWVFALSALFASAVIVGQIVLRTVRSQVASLMALRPAGIRVRELALASVMGPSLAVVLGTGVGTAVALEATRWTPIGRARDIEPDPGRRIDWVVFTVAPAASVAAVVASAVLASVQASRRLGRRRVEARRSTLLRRAAMIGVPVSVLVGIRHAVGSDRSAGPQSGRSAPAVTIALAGVFGAMMFGFGLGGLIDRPDRLGQINQFEAFVGANAEDEVPARLVAEAVARGAQVTGVNDTRQANATAGNTSFDVITFDPVGEPVTASFRSGRLPNTEDEIALGVSTAKALDAVVGSTVEIEGSAGTGSFTVCGIGFLPFADFPNTGAWLRPTAFDRLFHGFAVHDIDVAVRPGGDPEEDAATLKSLAGTIQGAEELFFAPADPQFPLDSLREMRRMPVALIGFFSFAGAAAAGHGITSAVRRHQSELAVLRAVGMTSRQVRRLVAAHAMTTGIIGVTLGTPLGVLSGVTIWHSFTEGSIPLFYENPASSTTWLAVVPIAIGVVVLLAWMPARRAARGEIAEALQAE